MAKGDRQVNRLGPRVKVGGRRPNETYLFGTDEEVDARGDGLAMAPGAENPSKNPTSFSAIPGKSGTGESINRAPLTGNDPASDFKWSRGVGKP